MALLSLTATPQPKTGTNAPLNLTALLAAGVIGSNTGVSFSNTGKEVLYVQQSATPSTIVVTIGTTIEGQPVSSITLTGVASAIQMVGPFPADENQPGGLINITITTPANVTGVALVQNAGVV